MHPLLDACWSIQSCALVLAITQCALPHHCLKVSQPRPMSTSHNSNASIPYHHPEAAWLGCPQTAHCCSLLLTAACSCLTLLTHAHDCSRLLTVAHAGWQALGPLPELIQADQMWQQRTDHHGHAHPGSPGSKRTKLSINSSRNAACLETLADASKACGPDDLQIQQTLYNTSMTALVQLTVKDQGQGCVHPSMAANVLLLLVPYICISMFCCCCMLNSRLQSVCAKVNAPSSSLGLRHVRCNVRAALHAIQMHGLL